jgi:heat shock protein HtpX
MSTPAAAPVLVYNRIANNRLATWVLMLLSAVLLLPVALPASGYLAFWSVLLFGPSTASSMYSAIALGAPVLVAILLLEYLYAARLVLFSAKANSLPHDQHPELSRIVENVCIGCGMPAPPIYLINAPALNALSVGLSPKRTALVFTSGLVSQLEYRELEAVVAHELAHIRNRDTRLGTLLAAIVATFWLPARIVRAVFDLLYFIHPALWIVALLWFGFQLSFGVITGLSLLNDVLFVHRGGLLLVAMAAGWGYVIFVSPFVAVLLRRLLWQQREELADAEAVLLTRYPPGLENALAKITAKPTLPVNPATAHLFIADPLVGSSRLFDRLFSAHPRMSERIALIAREGPGLDQQKAAAHRITPPVSVLEILLAVETWPRTVYAALLLLLGPVMLGVVRGMGYVLGLYDNFALVPAVLGVWAIFRWRASRAWLNRLLDKPLFADTGGSRQHSA